MSTSIEDLLNSVESDEDISLGDGEELDLESLLKGDDDDDEPLSATTISILKTTKSLFASAGHSPATGNSAVDLTNTYTSALASRKAELESNTRESLNSSPVGDILRDIEASNVSLPPLDMITSRSTANNLDKYNHPSQENVASPVPPSSHIPYIDGSTVVTSDNMALLQAEAREQRTLNIPDKIGLSALQIRRANSAGVISNMTSLEDVSEVTKQLLRNGSYEMHGPGTATTMAICNKFIAVGTVKGFVILFDHKQEIRRVLSFQQALANTASSSLSSAAASLTMNNSNNNNSNNNNTRVSGPSVAVTALDCLSDGSGILAGHKNGDIFLWDTIRGTILRQFKDPNNAEIVSLGFLPSISLKETKINGSLGESEGFLFVTWSSNHVINRFKMSRSLLTLWHHEVDCLLDDRAGPVLSMSMLKPCPTNETADQEAIDTNLPPRIVKMKKTITNNTNNNTNNSSVVQEWVDIKQLNSAYQFFSFGFAHQTCIVQVQPEVKIIHKWKLNSTASAMQHNTTNNNNTNNNNNNATNTTNSSTNSSTAGNNSSGNNVGKEILDWAWLPLCIASPSDNTNGTNNNTNSANNSININNISTPAELGANVASQAAALLEAQAQQVTRYVPVLTRCRGRFIEVLAMRTYKQYFFDANNTANSNKNNTFANNSANNSTNNSNNTASTTSMMATALRRSSLQLLGGFMSGVTNSGSNNTNSNTYNNTNSGFFQPDNTNNQVTIGFDFTVIASTLVKFSEEEALDRLNKSNDNTNNNNDNNNAVNNDPYAIVDVKWINSSQLIAMTQREALLFDLNLVCLERVALPKPIGDVIYNNLHINNAINNHVYQTFFTRAYSQQVYILLTNCLYRIVVKSALDQVNSLVSSGRWLEGLARLVDAVHKSPPLLQTEAEHIKRFIHNYALLAVKRTSSSSISGATSFSTSRHNNAISNSTNNDHFQLVASVCVEYCVATQNMDVLCNEILEIFRSEAQQGALLEALEPWIVSGHIQVLPARVIAEFLEMAALSDKLRTIERCVPHFDPHTLDLNFVSRFLFGHKMFASFLYVYAYGVGDFKAAFQMVFEHVCRSQQRVSRHNNTINNNNNSVLANMGFLSINNVENIDENDSCNNNNTANITTVNTSDEDWLYFVTCQAETIYKLLLFLYYVFKGKIFPRGSDTIYSIATVWTLLSMLVDKEWDGVPPLFTSSTNNTLNNNNNNNNINNKVLLLTKSYPHLRLLMAVDKGAVFYVIQTGLKRLQEIVSSVANQPQTTPSTISLKTTVDTADNSDINMNNSDNLESENDEMDLNKPSADTKILHVLYHLFAFCRTFDNEQLSNTTENTADKEEDNNIDNNEKISDNLWSRQSRETIGPFESDFFDHFLDTLCALRTAALPWEDLLPHMLSFARQKGGIFEHYQYESQFLLLAEKQAKYFHSQHQQQCISHEERNRHLQRLHDTLATQGFYLAALKVFASVSFISPIYNSYNNTNAQDNSNMKKNVPVLPDLVTTPVRHYLSICKYVDKHDAAYDLAFRYLDTLLQQQATLARAHENNAYVQEMYSYSRQQVRSVLMDLYQVDVTRTAKLVVQHMLQYLSEIVRQSNNNIVHPPNNSNGTFNNTISNTIVDNSNSEMTMTQEEAEFLRLSFLMALLKEYKATFLETVTPLPPSTSSNIHLAANSGANNSNNNVTVNNNNTLNGNLSASYVDVVSAGYLHEQDLLIFVKLQAQFTPDQLVHFLREYKDYCALDECLEIAKQHGVYDSVAYLLERAGDISGALTVLLQDISLKTRQARRDIDTQLRLEQNTASTSNTTSNSPTLPLLNSSGTISKKWRGNAAISTNSATLNITQNNLSSQSQLWETMQTKVPVVKRLRVLVEFVVQLCERQQEQHELLFNNSNNNHTDNNNDDNLNTENSLDNINNNSNNNMNNSSDDLWFKALDHLLAERHALRGGTISSASELVSHCLSHLLQFFLTRMLSSGRVAAQAVMTRVVTHASSVGLRLSEFRDIMLSMLRGQEQGILQRHIVRGVLKHDVHVLQRHKHAQHKRAMVFRSDTSTASLHVKSSSSMEAVSHAKSSVSSSTSSGVVAQPKHTTSPVVQVLHESLLQYSHNHDNGTLSDNDKEKEKDRLRRVTTGPKWKIRQLKDMRSMEARAREALVSLEPVTCVPATFDSIF